MAKKSIFSWSPETYTVQALESLMGSRNKDDLWAIKQEYTRLRDIAHKRLIRLGQSEFRNTEAYKSHTIKILHYDPETKETKWITKHDFPKLKDIKIHNLPSAMQEIYKFLSAKTSTVSGQRDVRQKTIDTWQKNGLNLTQANYDKVMAVMKELRIRKILYGSDKVVTAVETIMSKGFDFNKIINSPQLGAMIKAPSKLKRVPKKAGDRIDEYFKK